MKNEFRWLITVCVCFALEAPCFAANLVELSHQKLSSLKALSSNGLTAASNGSSLKQTATHLGKQGMKHFRFQQQFQGLDVLGADGVVHLPSQGGAIKSTSFQQLLASADAGVTMSGQVYQGLGQDLASPLNVFSESQAVKAKAAAVQYYQAMTGKSDRILQQEAAPAIFVDPHTQKAHYVYDINFLGIPARETELPARMNIIVDATDFTVYRSVNRMMTLSDDALVSAGGYGGNQKMGELTYDGLNANLHYRPLILTRNDDTKLCSFTNRDVSVKSYDTGKIINFVCDQANKDHDGLFWDANLGATNGGYSPENDALFAGSVIKDLYKQWYGLDVLITSTGRPMHLVMKVHKPWDNAAWDGAVMVFGDGITQFYPLTSIGIAAHEVSHGFTSQNSKLYYDFQSGAINEAFSDMAAKAAEMFAYGQVSHWSIGTEISKPPLEALRFMDKPSQDCYGNKPGHYCSIDNAKQYYNGLNVHYSSGVFNRAFYLLASSPGWDVRKAFGVMVEANRNYWTANTTFEQGACGVLAAANEMGEDSTAIVSAFNAVGIAMQNC